MKKVYVMSYLRKRAKDWARKNTVNPTDLIIVQDWETVQGIVGLNKVLHILPNSYKIKDYRVILEYTKAYGWAHRHVEE